MCDTNKQQTIKQAVQKIGPSRYELRNFQFTGRPGQILQFADKNDNGKGGFEVYVDGTSVDDILKVAIDRIQELNSKYPSKYNLKAISKIEKALDHLELRRMDRRERGVLGAPTA